MWRTAHATLCVIRIVDQSYSARLNKDWRFKEILLASSVFSQAFYLCESWKLKNINVRCLYAQYPGTVSCSCNDTVGLTQIKEHNPACGWVTECCLMAQSKKLSIHRISNNLLWARKTNDWQYKQRPTPSEHEHNGTQSVTESVHPVVQLILFKF